MLPAILRKLAAAGTADDVARVRIEIDDHASAGRIAPLAASALQAVARVAGEDIAAHGPRASKAPASGPEDRVAATIVECGEVSFDDTGASIRGTVALANLDAIRFTIRRSWQGSVKALYGACGVSADEPAEALAGHAVEVVVGEYAGRDGSPRACIKKWYRPAGTSKAAPTSAPAAAAEPAWESDEPGQEQARAPRRSPARKAAAEFKATSGGDSDIPF